MAAAPKAAPLASEPGPRKTRVLVADEAGIMRDGLCALLQSDDALEVVAATVIQREALQSLTTSQPDVAIVDFATDLKSGAETIAHLKHRWPEVRVLVLTVRRDEMFIETALRAGADRYVQKSERRAELLDAVHRAASGKRHISPGALWRGGHRPHNAAGSGPDTRGTLNLLAPSPVVHSPFMVGVSGHRDLDPDDLPRLREAVTGFVQQLRALLPDTELRMIVGM